MSRELFRQALNALVHHTQQTRPIHNTDLAIAALRSALAAPQPEPVAWIAVADKMPPEDVPCWLYEPGIGAWIGGWSNDADGWLWHHCHGSQYMSADGEWEANDAEADDYKPTHWMALPAAPGAAPPAAPAPAVPEMETRADGKLVRVDRWEWGIRRIVALLWGNRKEFEIDEVVQSVKELVPYTHEDDESLCTAVERLSAAPPAAAAPANQLTLNYAQAVQLMVMYADDADCEITLSSGDGHSGAGIYAHYSEYPEEGAQLLDPSEKVAALAAAPAPVVPEDIVMVPLSDAQMLLDWMDRTFSDGEGGDWFDEDAAAVADALNEALKRFKAAAPAAWPTPAMTDIDALLKSLRKEEFQKFRSDMQDDGIEAADTINALLVKVAALESAAPAVPLPDEQFADMVADASLAVDLAANPLKLLAFARAVLSAAPAVREPLTDEQIEQAVTVAVKSGACPWMGYKKDENGEYTLPVLSGVHYGIARAIEQAHGIGGGK